jgi:hypothetical protein
MTRCSIPYTPRALTRIFHTDRFRTLCSFGGGLRIGGSKRGIGLGCSYMAGHRRRSYCDYRYCFRGGGRAGVVSDISLTVVLEESSSPIPSRGGIVELISAYAKRKLTSSRGDVRKSWTFSTSLMIGGYAI